MTPEEFDKIVENAKDRITQSMQVKAKEYHRNNNPFHNFETGAKMTGRLREEVLDGMWLKHRVSVQDILIDLKDNKLPSLELLDEKIMDNINYLILLEGMIKERIEDSKYVSSTDAYPRHYIEKIV